MSACACAFEHACACPKSEAAPAAPAPQQESNKAKVVEWMQRVDVPHVFVFIGAHRPHIELYHSVGVDVVSGYRDHRGEWVILGADYLTEITPKQLCNVVLQHVREVRSFNHTRNAKLVVILENNKADSEWIAEYISRFGGADQVMMREKPCKAGVFSISAVLDASRKLLHELIARDAIRISHDFVTAGDESDVVAGLRNQLRRDSEPGAALRLMLFWGTKFFTDDAYAAHR